MSSTGPTFGDRGDDSPPEAGPSGSKRKTAGATASSSYPKQPVRVAPSSTQHSDEDSDGGGGDGEMDGRKAKRARVSVSCKECKRRKIKCDRQMPVCTPCEKRRQPESCTWDIFSGLTGAHDGVLPPSIARTTDLDHAIARIAHIESFLKAALPPNLAVFTPYVTSSNDGQVLEDQRARYGGASHQSGPAGAGEGAAATTDEAFWEVENAALNLENGVFGGAQPPRSENKAGMVKVGISAGPPRASGPPFVSTSSGPVPTSAGGPIPAGSHRQPTSTTTTTGGRFGAPSIELTKALTTIVANERPPESLSRAHLNVEFDAPSHVVERARSNELTMLIRALPERESVTHLVELYFTRVSWLFHHLHAPTFLVEVEAFHKLCDEARGEEVDSCFLALLLMVLCVALDSTHASRSPLSLDPVREELPNPLSAYTPEELKALPERWFAASQRALRLAEWETIPRIRSIQTIVLYTQYLQLCSPTRGQPSQLSVWLAASIRLAQVMGLHLLGSNPEVMPPDDPAFPPGKCSIKRETAKRLWAVLVYQDWLGATAKNRCYLISPLHFDTDDPLNLNDSDLSSIDSKVNPAPNSVLTDSSSDRVRVAMARQVRKSFDAIVLTRTYSYEKVLELDRGYKAILESLPDQWTLESSTGGAEQPMLRFQRHFVIEGIHNRIFRLHRPFSTRGYTEPKYRPSTDACLKSARVVVVSTHNIADATRDIWYSYSHVMGAALVLFNDLFMSIDHDASDSEIDSKRDVLHLALEIFTKGSGEITSASLQAVVQQGAKIMNGLFRAEESRRTGRAAQALLAASSGDSGLEEGQDDTPVETFADVLRRISRSLNTQSAPHRGTPPPTRNIPKKPSHLLGGGSTSSANHFGNGAFSQPSSAALSAAFPLNPSSSSTIDVDPTTYILDHHHQQQHPPRGDFHQPGDATPTVSAFEASPWPFPTGYGGAEDDLSAQFLQELDLGVGSAIGGMNGGGTSGEGLWGAVMDSGPFAGVYATGQPMSAGLGGQGQQWAATPSSVTTSGINFSSTGMGELGGGW